MTDIFAPDLPQPLGQPNGIAKPVPGQIGVWWVWTVGDATSGAPSSGSAGPPGPPGPPGPGSGGMLPLVTGQTSPGTGPWAIADPSGQFIGVPLS